MGALRKLCGGKGFLQLLVHILVVEGSLRVQKDEPHRVRNRTGGHGRLDYFVRFGHERVRRAAGLFSLCERASLRPFAAETECMQFLLRGRCPLCAARRANLDSALLPPRSNLEILTGDLALLNLPCSARGEAITLRARNANSIPLCDRFTSAPVPM